MLSLARLLRHVRTSREDWLAADKLFQRFSNIRWCFVPAQQGQPGDQAHVEALEAQLRASRRENTELQARLSAVQGGVPDGIQGRQSWGSRPTSPEQQPTSPFAAAQGLPQVGSPPSLTAVTGYASSVCDDSRHTQFSAQFVFLFQ